MLSTDLVTTKALAAAVALLLAYPICQAIYNITFHPLAKIPGSKLWSCSRFPFIHSLLRGTIIHDFQALHEKYGPVLRIGPDEVTFADPDAYQDILQIRADHQQFLKDPTWWNKQDGQDENLITANNPDVHARMRKMLVPAFTVRALRAQEPIVQRYVNLLIERLSEHTVKNEDRKGTGSEINISTWMNFTTFDIFGDLGFGESFDCLQQSRYHPWIALLFNSVKMAACVAASRYYPLVDSLLMKCIPSSLRKMQEDHFQQIADKVQRRLNWELERPDIMSYVINEGSEKKKALPLGEIQATFNALTIAGSETTATALTGTINCLVNDPNKLKLLEEEVRSTFRDSGDMSLDALQNLPYLNAVLTEGMRLCPPIPWVLPRRVPVGGDTVCGVWLPGGTRVSVQAYTMNRSPENFHLPTSFHPERWLPSSTSATSPFRDDKRHIVQPFSVGPRNCIGQNLAWAELRLVLAKLVWHLDIEKGQGAGLKWEDLRTFLLWEIKPLSVKLRVREA